MSQIGKSINTANNRLLRRKFQDRKTIVVFVFALLPIMLVFSSICHWFIAGESIFQSLDLFDNSTVPELTLQTIILYFSSIATCPVSLPFSMAELLGLAQNTMLIGDGPVGTIYYLNPGLIIAIFWVFSTINCFFLFWSRFIYFYLIHSIFFLISSIYWVHISFRILLI